MGYRACLIDEILRGSDRFHECWVQGVIIGSRYDDDARNVSSFVLDDGSGAIECFLPHCSRSHIFSMKALPCVVVEEQSSAQLLRFLNERTEEDCAYTQTCGRSPVPRVGAYIALWGGLVCLVCPKTLRPTFRLVVVRWQELFSEFAESNWLATLAS